ncbi:Sterol regulatory element-binding 1 [Lecanosticta acicola]|uniref:Sterol regulatory element-binding 1 n=1 Tax=Lecanosticta acicola TaxID=111012 RepID=A0AAI9ED82_9PEZI|nr:Sterol regulatory element-binding 1 [Lecanosticta acicola]
MVTSWQGSSSQQMSPFGMQLDGSQNHEDWEEWLRWDPTAEATSPDDGTFGSGSSRNNDSPLQDPLLHDFGKTDDEALVPPLIVGDNSLGFGTADDLGNDPFLLGTATDVDLGFGMDQSAIATFNGISDIPKLDTNTAAWSMPSDVSGEPNIPLSAVSNDQNQQPQSAISFTATTPSLHHSPESSSQNRNSISSTSPDPPKKRGGRKRKAETQLEKPTADSAGNGDSQSGGDEPANKTSHNVIEKRYRNNLNDKIVELRNSVPSLRAMGRANVGKESEDLEGLTPAHKLNKATVMAKATEYIRHLEKRNKTLADEMATLKAQLAKVEAAIGKSSDRQASMSNSPPSTSVRSRGASSASQGSVPNFLNVPQDQSRFGQPVIQQQHTQQQGQPSYSRPPNPPVEAQNQPQFVNGRGGVMNKVLLGTMAGIMVMEGYSEQQSSGQDTSDRSLFAVPTAFFKRALDGGVSAVPRDLSRQAMLPLLKIVLVVGALYHLLAPFLAFSPRRKQKMRTSAQLPKAPSLASPVEVRRKAWGTAIQTVWVPKHFLLEVVAVGMKMLQLSLRRLIGPEAFAHITGTNKEEEAARIKAWDIAIDAQLAGGDAEVSYYRLLLTLMESGTLPDSPARLMQKAVHFRVFFWEVANAGYGNMVGFKQFTEKVGKFYWDSARRLQKDLVHAKSCSRVGNDDEVEVLPDHLARLVELDCDEVLGDEMIQRAWNLAWNKPSAHGTMANPAKDSVVEDHAIRSPLDAVAAWYTHTTIDDTLADAFSDTASTFDTEYYLGLALSVAPPASHTHVRALAAKAVLSNSNREANIVVALEALPVLSPTGGMNLVNHTPVAPDVCIALTIAKLISLCSPSSSKTARDRALEALARLQLSPAHLTLLTAVAAYRLLRLLRAQRYLQANTEAGMEDLAGSLRVWVGTSAGRDSGLDREGRGKIVKLCLNVTKHLGGWDDQDSGYGSAPNSQSSSPLRANVSPVVLT